MGVPSSDLPDDVMDESRVEDRLIRRRRYREARKAGMNPADARWFAESKVDVGELRHLVALSCPSATLFRILF